MFYSPEPLIAFYSNKSPRHGTRLFATLLTRPVCVATGPLRNYAKATQKALRNREMIILVTGATAGFGEGITRRFVKNGHKVIATGRRQERLQALKDELGDSVLTLQRDVRNRAAIEQAMENLP